MRTKFFRNTLTAAAVAASLGVALPAAANNTNGFIQGNAIEADGKVLRDVSITIVNTETGLKRTVTSDGNGVFRFPLLPPGTYNLTAEKDGYQTAMQESIAVGISGKVNMNLTLAQAGVERIQVTGRAISLVDVTSTTTGIVVDSVTLDRIPVARDLTSVALLAPGTTKGDSAFGNLPSIGGASVAENAYYVNGLNLTNFRTGVGSSNPPFEMYDSFEVKTGGYSAEFGRVTGGVINAKTKSGTNEFKWGVNAIYEPDGFRSDKPSATRQDGTYRIDNTGDKNDMLDLNLWASGALIQDKLFVYALYNPRSDEFDYNGGQSLTSDGVFQSIYNDKEDDAFWGVNIDWYINENNILELTGFSDKSQVVTTRYTSIDGEIVGDGAVGFQDKGGLNYTAKYTSIISDDFSVSAQYGVNETDRTTQSALDANPAVYRVFDSTGAFVPGGNWANFSVDAGDDKREVFRIDADWYFGDHQLRFGVDYEKLTANSNTTNSGNAYYLLYVDDVTDPNNPEIYQVRHRIYNAGGSFDSKNIAFYVQDQWQVSDNLVLNLGIRNDSFENFNGAGDSFVKLSNQWAPRVGAVYDLSGDGSAKVWASAGRYYLPVAANTNIRLAGAETYIQNFYEFDGFADTTLEIPNLTGAFIRDQVFADGDVPGTGEIVDANLDSMYSDEFIAGYQFQLNDEWSVGIQATYRELKTTIEDVAIDFGFNQYLEREFGSGCTLCDGFHYYVLTNPGTDLTLTTDPDGNGPLALDTYTIPAEDLNYPESVRKYGAVDVKFERAWDGVWLLNATYTWSHSWGNNEGYVRSDNGQDDAGLTTLFDQPGLLDGAYGDLPNDRRHSVKVFGSYQVIENLNVGLNFQWQSGRPRNAFGFHPTDEFAQQYGSESFYAGGQLVPRGSLGTTPSSYSIDLSASYEIALNDDYDLTLRMDVFNLLNTDQVTEVSEIYDLDTSDPQNPSIDPDFGQPTNWQTPRYVRLSASLRF